MKFIPNWTKLYCQKLFQLAKRLMWFQNLNVNVTCTQNAYCLMKKNSWKQKRNVTKTIRCVQNTYLFTFAQLFQIRLTAWLDGLNNLLFRPWYITSPAWAIWNRVKPRPHLKSIFSAFDQGLQPLLPERSPSLSLTYYSKIVQSISNTSQRVLPTHGCQTTTFIHTCKEIMADRSS